eukprot:CAMPEP_0196825384 /NCGR_PEP_ID=MMETSP1362-20130617/93022_1 /TAXON_ID=163516 /ORGANISM="Leptocylindrus danicus, Strain CCMP1856" /LENGTH=36 /DNA_ID= /DNA_START= /DNA_END= /DNA_ORIENTATION=
MTILILFELVLLKRESHTKCEPADGDDDNDDNIDPF